MLSAEDVPMSTHDSKAASAGGRAPRVRGLQTATLCSESCAYPEDGLCDDGGSGSQYDACDYGSDCTDCGARAPRPPLPPQAPPAPPPYYPPSIVVSGLCQAQYTHDGTYTLRGTAANGAPYYSNSDGRWLYHDPDCNGAGTVAMWMMNAIMPDISRSYDLENDGVCLFSAQYSSADLQPPMGTWTWQVYCDGA
eukprot:2880079-Prymnesium_polylepis.1